jgi:hypothetical protein
VVKAAREEADHSHISSAEIKNEWSCTFSLPTSFHGVDMGNFTLTFYRITRICNIHSKNYTISKLNKMGLLEALKKKRVDSFYAMKAYGGVDL